MTIQQWPCDTLKLLLKSHEQVTPATHTLHLGTNLRRSPCRRFWSIRRRRRKRRRRASSLMCSHSTVYWHRDDKQAADDDALFPGAHSPVSIPLLSPWNGLINSLGSARLRRHRSWWIFGTQPAFFLKPRNRVSDRWRPDLNSEVFGKGSGRSAFRPSKLKLAS